jgi:hypothetical protein
MGTIPALHEIEFASQFGSAIEQPCWRRSRQQGETIVAMSAAIRDRSQESLAILNRLGSRRVEAPKGGKKVTDRCPTTLKITNSSGK